MCILEEVTSGQSAKWDEPAGGYGGRGGYGNGGGFGGGGGGGGGGRRYDNRGPPAPRGSGWGSSGHEENPFEADAARKQEVDSLFQSENTGINFDAYEDIPVRAPHVLR